MSTSATSFELPDELVHLIQLHSSFLSALSLHYAHNGTAAPVDLVSLIPAITRLYRKRKVTIDDVQLCVGQLQQCPPDPQSSGNRLALSDFGRGRICIELEEQRLRAGIMNKHLDEEKLLEVFQERLKGSWNNWIASQQPSLPTEDISSDTISPKKRKRSVTAQPATLSKRQRGRPGKQSPLSTVPIVPEQVTTEQITAFIAQLPRAPIIKSSSLDALTPSKRKGEQMLAELKANASKPSASKDPRTPTKSIKHAATPAPSPSASARGSSLLERIRAKQALAAASPRKALSKAELERKSALSRASEVLDIINLIAQEKRRGNSTASVSLASLVQQVQQSVRTPIGEDEVRSVVDTLAEIMEEYVKIVRTTNMSYVTIHHYCKPPAKLLQERIESATAALA